MHARRRHRRTEAVFNVIIDILGKASFDRCKHSLTRQGRLVYVSFKMKQILQMLWTTLVGGSRMVCAVVHERREDLELVAGLVAANRYRTVVDKTFPLEHAAEAHRYAESTVRKGPLVITVW